VVVTFDPFADDAIADPHPIYARLRQHVEQQVHRVDVAELGEQRRPQAAMRDRAGAEEEVRGEPVQARGRTPHRLPEQVDGNVDGHQYARHDDR